MTEAVIVAIITGACAIIAQLLISKASAKDLYAKLDKQSELSDQKLDAKIAVMDTKIVELTREVREHNNFARRLPVVEEQINVLNREMKEVKGKI